MGKNKPTTFTIPGTDVKLPQWALLAGGGGILAALFFLKGDGDGSSFVPVGEVRREPQTGPRPGDILDIIDDIIPDDDQGLPGPSMPGPAAPQKAPAKVPKSTIPVAPIIITPPTLPTVPVLGRPKPPVGPPGIEPVSQDAELSLAQRMLSQLGRVRSVAVAVKSMQQVKPKPNLPRLRRAALRARKGRPREKVAVERPEFKPNYGRTFFNYFLRGIRKSGK